MVGVSGVLLFILAFFRAFIHKQVKSIQACIHVAGMSFKRGVFVHAKDLIVPLLWRVVEGGSTGNHVLLPAKVYVYNLAVSMF